MAQDDNDFIGFLMKTFFKLVGWIFLGIFKTALDYRLCNL